MSKIHDNNFIIRMLYKDVYWLYCTLLLLSFYVHDAFCHRVVKRIYEYELHFSKMLVLVAAPVVNIHSFQWLSGTLLFVTNILNL